MFAGGGVCAEALHLAVSDAGVQSELKWVAECESKYIEAAGENCLAITDDTVVLVGKVEEIEREHFTNVDVLQLSMPCAGFSGAGKAKHGMTPEMHSGTAIFGVSRAIESAQPAIIISENVIEARDSAMYALLICELERLGYVVFQMVLDSENTGTFEQRKRWWFVAFSKGIAPESFTVDDMLPSNLTLNDLLDKSVPESAWTTHPYLVEKEARDIAAGKGFRRQLLKGDEKGCGTIGRFYSKRRSTEPFIVRPDNKERLLSLTEHARVKSVPEHLVAGLKMTVGHEILGQSVDFMQPYLIMSKIMELPIYNTERAAWQHQ